MPEARPDDCSCRLGFSIQPGRLLRVLVLIATVLAVIGFAVHSYLFLSGGSESARFGSTLTKFGVNIERSIPTWFSAVVLLLGSVALLFCYQAEARRRRGHRCFWAGLALVVLAMSVDEIAGFHENFHYIITRRTAFRGSGAFRYAWVLVGIPFVALLTIAATPFLWRLRRKTAVLLVISGGIYFSGSLGLEMVAAYLRDIHDGDRSLGFYIATTLEEYFEMVGASLLCYAALDYIRSRQFATPPKPIVVTSGSPVPRRKSHASASHRRRRPRTLQA